MQGLWEVAQRQGVHRKHPCFLPFARMTSHQRYVKFMICQSFGAGSRVNYTAITGFGTITEICSGRVYQSG